MELIEAVAYCNAGEEEKDYAGLLSSCPAHPFADKCMYCGDCIGCGQCETRCPFGVKIAEHMGKAREIFGE